MNRWIKHIGWLLSCMIMLLGQACTDEDEHKDSPVLQIHVFTPEHPVVTRGDIGPVEADALEKRVNDLRIWVYESNNGNPVGYLHPTDFSEDGGTYLMDVSNDFVDRQPNVDVFVMANVTTDNCNLNDVPDGSATRAELEAIMIKNDNVTHKDPFGLTTPQKSLTENDYLPMTGVLKQQPVGGSAPVLSVGNVRVVRAVSKVRFIFSRSSSEDKELKIKKITFNGGVIPKSEYLFLDQAYTTRSFHIYSNDGYEGAETEEKILLNETDAATISVPISTDPAKFAFNGAVSGQTYETQINTELTKTETETVKREIVEGGRFYLRESDKLVGGKIYFQIGEDEEKSVEFFLKEAGDFTRNHTWIVYGYFAGNNNLRIFTVVFTPWVTLSEETHSVYNW